MLGTKTHRHHFVLFGPELHIGPACKPRTKVRPPGILFSQKYIIITNL